MSDDKHGRGSDRGGRGRTGNVPSGGCGGGAGRGHDSNVGGRGRDGSQLTSPELPSEKKPQVTNNMTCRQIKVAVIDSGMTGIMVPEDIDCFSSKPVTLSFHDKDCPFRYRPAYLGQHGYTCARIVCSKERYLNYSGALQDSFVGVFPSAQLYTYGVGCGTNSCGLRTNQVADAIIQAIEDKVDVISFSAGVKNSLIGSKKYDVIGLSLLDAFEKDIVSCVAIGNEGPLHASADNGMPWCINVGASTSGKVLVTKLDVATDVNVRGKVPKDVTIWEKPSTRTASLTILDKLEGYALNMEKSNMFFKLGWLPEEKLEECHISLDKASGHYLVAAVTPEALCHLTSPSNSRNVLITNKNYVDMLYEYQSEYGHGHLFVKPNVSEYIEDGRGVMVAHFSSRGPSMLYPNSIVPDVIAPGYALLLPQMGAIFDGWERRFSSGDCTIASGTSYACPFVAGCALEIRSLHPDWSASAVKSALMTIAKSFTTMKNGDDEMSFGAGSVDRTAAIDPGLVYEETAQHYHDYVDGRLEMYQLNQPQFAAGFSPNSGSSTRYFSRELTNVGVGDATYKFELEWFLKPPVGKVKITAHPSILTFESYGEKKKFVLEVKVLACPVAPISGLVKWSPMDKERRRPVSCPLYLYEHSLGFRNLHHISQIRDTFNPPKPSSSFV